MKTAHLRLVPDTAPSTEKRTVGRRPNAEYRQREHLERSEVDRLMAAARDNRYGHRDATMLLIAFRHGLRASEVCALQWEQVNFEGFLHVRRVKKSNPSTHPLDGEEIRALRRLKREQQPPSTFVFTTERGGPFTTDGFRRMVERAAEHAKLDIKAHAHMLRHGCGYALANKGVDTRAIQDYLGHKNIQHTVRYTQLSPNRFKNLWSD